MVAVDGAVTDSSFTGVQTQSDWATGSTYRAGVPGVVDIAHGETRVVEPPRLLIQ